MTTDDRRVRFVGALQRGSTGLTERELVERLDDAPITLVVNPQDQSLQAQTSALAAVNLLSRLFRRLVLVIPQEMATHPALPFLAGQFGTSLADFAGRVHSQVRVELRDRVQQQDTTLYIGRRSEPQTTVGSYCCGAGWVARVARHPISLEEPLDDNPVGPLIAGALGASEVFKLVFGDVLTGVAVGDDVTFSALTYRIGDTDPGSALGQLKVPETVLVGAGSIGSALLWGIAHVRAIEGSLRVIDPDKLAEHNPDRAILVLDEAAHQAMDKAPWARDAIKQYVPALDVTASTETIREFVDTLDEDYRLPLAISAVDSIESRRDIQDALPRETLNASTGATNVEVSSHGNFGRAACLYCLYLPEVLERSVIQVAMERTGFGAKDTAEFLMEDAARRLTSDNIRGIEQRNKLAAETLQIYEGRGLSELLSDQLWYGQAPIPVEGAQALVTTAFVSAFAGFLLLAEWLKTANPALAEYRLDGVYQQDLLGIPNEFRYAVERDQTGYCLCHSPIRRELYATKYGVHG